MKFMVQRERAEKVIGAGRYTESKKKPLQVGSFHGALPDAKKHAEAAILRLKERIQKQRR